MKGRGMRMKRRGREAGEKAVEVRERCREKEKKNENGGEMCV